MTYMKVKCHDNNSRKLNKKRFRSNKNKNNAQYSIVCVYLF